VAGVVGADDAGGGAHDRVGVVDGAQGRHPLAAVFLPTGQAGREPVGALGRGGFRGGLAQRLGAHHHPSGVDGQHQQRVVGGRHRHPRGVEGVDVGGGAYGQRLDLPLADPGPGGFVDLVAGGVERAAYRLLGRGAAQPVRVHLGRQVQHRVGRVQV
jgi:hypothetical protein